MIKRTEKDIKKGWYTSPTSPLVSISCFTYNHEKYINQAIDGMLMQETTFPFEILIHDDASTDSTPEIISLYQKKYPNIIKTIYQTENQYSKGSNITSYNFMSAKGKYIALCEGDDYWTDKEKLQFQIDKMREHNECQISFHPAMIVNDQTVSEEVVARHLEHDTIFDVKEIIKGDGGFCPTPSIIIKKEVIDNLPEFYTNSSAGDYCLQVLGAENAGALYINRTMSAYRIHPNGVWTSKLGNFKLLKKHAINLSKTLKELDIYYNFTYKNEFDFVISNVFTSILSDKSFHIDDRTTLYHICKKDLSIEQKIECLEELIEEQTSLLNMGRQHSQLYLDLGDGYNEKDSIKLPAHQHSQPQTFTFTLANYENLTDLRLDPLNDSCIIEIEELKILRSDHTELDLLPRISTNDCTHHGKSYYFITMDPNINFEELQAENLQGATELIATIRYTHIGRNALEAFSSQIILSKDTQIKNQAQQIQALQDELSQIYTGRSWRYMKLVQNIKKLTKGGK